MIPGLYPIFQRWGDKGTIWVISDTHFAESPLSRPFSDEALVKRINTKVGKNDTLIHLGDCGSLEYCAKLKGYKVLIKGNHDDGIQKYERKEEWRIFPFDEYTEQEARAAMMQEYPGHKISVTEQYSHHQPFHFWMAYADNCLFDEIYSGPLFIGPKLLLSHEPIADLPYTFNLHGHAHNATSAASNTINCCIEKIGYNPISLTSLAKAGFTSHIDDIHRQTISKATERKNHNAINPCHSF